MSQSKTSDLLGLTVGIFLIGGVAYYLWKGNPFVPEVPDPGITEPPGPKWYIDQIDQWMIDSYPDYNRRLLNEEKNVLELSGDIYWIGIAFTSDWEVLHVRTVRMILSSAGADHGDLYENIVWTGNEEQDLLYGTGKVPGDKDIKGIYGLVGYRELKTQGLIDPSFSVPPKPWGNWTTTDKFSFMSLVEVMALITEPRTWQQTELSARRYFYYQVIPQTQHAAYLFRGVGYSNWWEPIDNNTPILPNTVINNVESIKLAPGQYIELYDQIVYQGDSFRVYSSAENLDYWSWSNRAESVKLVFLTNVESQLSEIVNYLIKAWVYRNGEWLFYDPTDPLGSDLGIINHGEVVFIQVAEWCTLFMGLKSIFLFPDRWNEVVWEL